LDAPMRLDTSSPSRVISESSLAGPSRMHSDIIDSTGPRQATPRSLTSSRTAFVRFCTLERLTSCTSPPLLSYSHCTDAIYPKLQLHRVRSLSTISFKLSLIRILTPQKRSLDSRARLGRQGRLQRRASPTVVRRWLTDAGGCVSLVWEPRFRRRRRFRSLRESFSAITTYSTDDMRDRYPTTTRLRVSPCSTDGSTTRSSGSKVVPESIV
jgi:hypothetical protein